MPSKSNKRERSSFAASWWTRWSGCRIVDDLLIADPLKKEEKVDRLDNEGHQYTLLARYANIETGAQALSFVEEFGFPIRPYAPSSVHDWEKRRVFQALAHDAGYLPISEMLETAAFLRSLKNIADWLQSDLPLLEKFIRVGEDSDERVSDQDRVGGWLSVWRSVAADYDALMALITAEESKKGKLKDQPVQRQTNTGKSLRIVITQQPKAFRTVTDDSRSWVGWEYDRQPPDDVAAHVSRERWETHKTAIVANLFRFYLQERINDLLHGIQPGFGLQLNRGLNSPGVLEPLFILSTPWQAMSLALWREITGHSNIKPCARCNKFFIPKRSHGKVCSVACEQALRRKKQRGESES